MPASHPENSFVTPALASALTGLSPYLLRRLAVDAGGPGRTPPVRSARVGGRFLVRLSDVLRAAGARPSALPEQAWGDRR
jgi:hypothetical protein